MYKGAFEFFNVILSNIHKWSASKVRYGCAFIAFLCMLGTRCFIDCVSGAGRYIHADECSVDKARLDFVRILISTPHIEIIDTTSEFLIDESKYVIKLVE